MGASPQSGFQGLIKTILTSLGGDQPETNADSPEASAAPAPAPVAAPPMSENIPGLPTGTTPASAVSAIPPGVLNQPYPVKKRTPLDYLMMAASPVVSGLVQSLLAQRHRGRAFAAGALQTGFGEAASELERPERIKALQHQRDIENILLQKNVRGTPIQGVDKSGQGVTMYPGTQEVIPGIGPQPRVARVPKIVTQRDATGNETPYEVNDKGEATPITVQQGNTRVPMVSQAKPEKVETRETTNEDGTKTLQEYDPKKKVWKAATQETTDAQGNTVQKPVISQREPMRELRVGSELPGKKKGTVDDQFYWVEQGKPPVASGLYRSASDRPTREGDINRSEKKQVNQWAIKTLQDSKARLTRDPKKPPTPEEIVNDAVKTFQEASGSSKVLAGKASEVSTAIRTIGRSVKSNDELEKIFGAFRDTGTAAPQ